MLDFVARENEIIQTLQALEDGRLEFVVVGGYAVSAYRHRYSVDADIVIKKEDKSRFEAVLQKRGYKKTVSMQLQNTYSSEFVRYEKTDIKVSIDILIGGMGMRQTQAAVGFDFLFKNSSRMEIVGTQNSVQTRVPKREVLIILKLHAGRLTDLRDIAALCYNLDMVFIKKHLFMGDRQVLSGNMKTLKNLIGKQNFQDSFKGAFMEKRYRIDIQQIKELASIKE